MNKKTVLPINGKRGLYFQSQEAQRDADWERILPLLVASERALACLHFGHTPCVQCTAALEEAYKQLAGETP